jgi:hypothetical protein
MRVCPLSPIVVRAAEPVPPSIARVGQLGIGGRPSIVDAGHAVDRSPAAGAGAVRRSSSTVAAKENGPAHPRPQALEVPNTG